MANDEAAYMRWLAAVQAQQQRSQEVQRAREAQMNFQLQMAQLAAQQQAQQMAYQGNPLDRELAMAQLDQQADLSSQYQKAYDDYRRDVEGRYLDILEGHVGTRNRVLGDINQFGESLVADTEQAFKKQAGDSVAALARAGLLGSTVRSSVEARNQRERQDALRRVKDTLLQNRTAADERLSGRTLDFMERRTDVPPDYNQLALLQRGLAMGPSRSGAVTAQYPYQGPTWTPGYNTTPGYTKVGNQWRQAPGVTPPGGYVPYGGAMSPYGYVLPRTGVSRTAMPRMPYPTAPNQYAPRVYDYGYQPNPLANYLRAGYDPNPIAPGRDLAAAMTGNLMLGQPVATTPGPVQSLIGPVQAQYTEDYNPRGVSPYAQSLPWAGPQPRQPNPADVAARRAREAAIRARYMQGNARGARQMISNLGPAVSPGMLYAPYLGY